MSDDFDLFIIRVSTCKAKDKYHDYTPAPQVITEDDVNGGARFMTCGCIVAAFRPSQLRNIINKAHN
jgi:hypothetical protein